MERVKMEVAVFEESQEVVLSLTMDKRILLNKLITKEKEYTNECIVAGCTNKRYEGDFAGPICMACYVTLVDGEFDQLSKRYIQQLKKRISAV